MSAKKYFVMLFLLLSSWSSFVHSQNAQTLFYSHGKYVGEVLNGKAHGFGTYTAYKSGGIYTGNFQQDTFQGQGTYTWQDGSRYVGSWQNDAGIQGTMFYPNGATAQGTVRNAVFIPSATPYIAPIIPVTPPASKPNNPNQLNKALYNQLGPSGWANCTAGQVAISALIARGDQINQTIKDTNRSLGTILGSLRQYMLANGTPASTLDDLIRNYSSQIKTGDQALRIVNDCSSQIALVNY
ncbi:hypothetical protein PSHI8_07380 [Polynucleobacter sp. SHI8]|uniref:hypothetical protein n=1 Tax=unclassified Polynucleobacter TaxID=2640945 RepID=UPI002493A3DB|nr:MULTISPECIES: hypothetical protein [unclassified Polynucleobacter]BDW10656.1 hypothetical protein PSHI2_07380 [Polynucleobacter sp. SHI2]BDW13102.1 hypothetical protein PSHI8_07380 [Polynucleobacter sp. SHI8]